jgi:hypothetical protein
MCAACFGLYLDHQKARQYKHFKKEDIMKFRVFKKDGLNFISLYFKIRTSDKYDVNYI